MHLPAFFLACINGKHCKGNRKVVTALHRWDVKTEKSLKISKFNRPIFTEGQIEVHRKKKTK